MVRRVYRHFGTCVMEVLLLPRLRSREALVRRVERVDFHYMDAALARGRGVILVAPHMGNWEVTALSLSAAGYDLRSITLPLANRYLHQHFLKLRTFTGHTLIPREGAVKGMLECLRQNGVLVFLADQNAHERGVKVPFFGRLASTIRTPAVMSIKCSAPIVPLNLHRVGVDRHRVVATPPIEPIADPDHEKAVALMTAEYTRRFESFIREHPEQWLWLHHRWSDIPEVVAVRT
jgi:KDO2-lipid IV(A) lauroyltransferase